MKRGGTILWGVATLAIAACTGSSGELRVRPMPTPLAGGERTVPFRIAEARGQFALGNVALALEGFRRALREDPASVDALTGIAACYDAMARFDLSRRHYEAGLAIAPGDTRLLTAFASSLDQQGRRAEAASVRTEISQRLTALRPVPKPAAPLVSKPAPVVAAAPEAAPIAKIAPPATIARQAPTPAVKAAAVRPRPAVAPIVPVQAAPKPVERQVKAVIPAPAPVVPTAAPAPTRVAMLAVPAVAAPPPPVARPAPPAPVVFRAVPAPAASPAPPAATAFPAPLRVAQPRVAQPQVASPAIGRSVTVTLPPARPVAPAAVAPPAPAITALPPQPAAPPVQRLAEKAPEAPAAVEQKAATPTSGQRIERTSLSEVTLVTTRAPVWRALAVNRTPRSATIRYVPLRQATNRFAGVRLLNAARVDRLAARTRAFLVGRGWRPMTIGNAQAVRDRSIIFYPAGKRTTAQTLSRQFGFAIAQRSGTRHIIVLLGRDAARVSALRAKG